MLTLIQAIVLGVLQGITELFPISSLGHSVILPQLLGWTDVVAAQSAPESYFLALLVGLHVATALALVVFYRTTWARIIQGLLTSVQTQRVDTPEQLLGYIAKIQSSRAAGQRLVRLATLNAIAGAELRWHRILAKAALEDRRRRHPRLIVWRGRTCKTLGGKRPWSPPSTYMR